MKTLNNFMKNLWQDESGQGMAEYVLLIVVILAIALIFKKQLVGMVSKKLDSVGGVMDSFDTSSGQ